MSAPQRVSLSPVAETFNRSRIAPAEFLRIARCGRPAATVLGVDVTFRPDQLKAIRAFANQILLKVPEPQSSR